MHSTVVRKVQLETAPALCSYTEWDPLEEVIVGNVDFAAVPPWHPTVATTMPEEHRGFFQAQGGRPFPSAIVDDAKRDLEGFIALLEREGVTVRVPEVRDFSLPFATPDWSSASGVYAAMPRDLLLVVGDLIIEVPMAWRSRYFEVNAYRRLLKEYFHAGARWVSAPRPTLTDELYRAEIEGPDGAELRFLTEFEPTFDAADFFRCGRDLFGQLSNVTNQFGVDWLRSCLGPDYRVHLVEVNDPHAMHIDATLVPLAPGKLLANPERLEKIPPALRDWELRWAPPPQGTPRRPFLMSSRWVSMNLLSLDETRVVVEAGEKELAAQLKGWGFDPIPCRFDAFNVLGGSFHCATLDVRRRGELRSYL